MLVEAAVAADLSAVSGAGALAFLQSSACCEKFVKVREKFVKVREKFVKAHNKFYRQ